MSDLHLVVGVSSPVPIPPTSIAFALAYMVANLPEAVLPTSLPVWEGEVSITITISYHHPTTNSTTTHTLSPLRVVFSQHTVEHA
jgi:hypothetical protein